MTDEPAKHEDGLRRMLADAHGRRYPGSAGVFYEHAPVGTGIAGGTGGGTVVAGIWLHPELEGKNLRTDVEAVLAGRTPER